MSATLEPITDMDCGERLAWTMRSERERAKDIIVEIVRQAGGSFELQTNLYKAFYYAHLQFARTSDRLLSKWPIVRMPNGPGIDDGADIILELVGEGRLELKPIDCGRVTGNKFVLCESAEQAHVFAAQEIAAIKFGISKVDGQSAAAVSSASHIESNTWKETENGRELAIYADLLTPEEFARSKRTAGLARDIFG